MDERFKRKIAQYDKWVEEVRSICWWEWIGVLIMASLVAYLIVSIVKEVNP